MSVAETCIAARDRLKPLLRYGEDAVWRPAKDAHDALADAANAVTELTGALKGLAEIFALPGEGSTARFDRLADAFYRDTGMMAPGKDAPMGMGGCSTEERSAAYDAWIAGRVSKARAALALPTPLTTKEPTA